MLVIEYSFIVLKATFQLCGMSDFTWITTASQRHSLREDIHSMSLGYDIFVYECLDSVYSTISVPKNAPYKTLLPTMVLKLKLYAVFVSLIELHHSCFHGGVHSGRLAPVEFTGLELHT